MPCTVHELGEAGVRLTHLLEQANNVSRQSGRRNHAQLEYVLTDLGAVGPWIDVHSDDGPAHELASGLELSSSVATIHIRPFFDLMGTHDEAAIRETIAEDVRAVQAHRTSEMTFHSDEFVFRRALHEHGRPAPPLEVKLVLHDITAQPVANVAHVFFERVEHGGTATLLQCGPSLLWNALTTLRSSSHGAATSASAARAVLVLAFVSALCQTHGTEFLCLGHEDWLAFLNTVDEAAYRELRSWVREELRGLGAPEHVAATVLEHAHEDREDLEAALESQIQSALDWAQRFFAVTRAGQFQPPPAAQFASLGHHAPSRFFPQDRRLVSSSSSRF